MEISDVVRPVWSSLDYEGHTIQVNKDISVERSLTLSPSLNFTTSLCLRKSYAAGVTPSAPPRRSRACLAQILICFSLVKKPIFSNNSSKNMDEVHISLFQTRSLGTSPSTKASASGCSAPNPPSVPRCFISRRTTTKNFVHHHSHNKEVQ